MITSVAVTVLNAQADTMARHLDDGWLDFYDGERPETANHPLDIQEYILGLQFNSPSAPSAENGIIRATFKGPGTAVRSGVISWARVYMADHRTKILDCSVGLAGSDANIIMERTQIPAGAQRVMDFWEHRLAGETRGM